MTLNDAIDDIRNGKIVLIYDFDDRERETDMAVASQFVTPEVIRTMRKDAGGLICTTTPLSIAKELGLPFMSDVLSDDYSKYPILKAMAPTDIPYDGTRSSFGITINHRRTYTGVTDNDRALTTSEYVKVLFSDDTVDKKIERIEKDFRSPGHVHLLNTSDRILEDRKGHTELSTALMILSGVNPSATICEMMGDDGNAMSKEDAKVYAEKNNYVFLEGKDIIEAWKRR